jgi:DNA-binding CsgD family transcriptional regulator
MIQKSTPGSAPDTHKDILPPWQSQKFDPDLSAYSFPFKDNPAMDVVLNAGPSLTVITDLRLSQYVYVTKNCEQLLGFTADEFLRKGIEFGLSLIHPEDINDYHKALKFVWDFLLALPPAKRKYYKTSADFRIRTRTGIYRRMLQQNTALQTDKSGNILLLLMVLTDISHLKKETGVSAAIISTENEGYLVWDAKDTGLKNQVAFSKRERELIKFLAEGFSTKQIADRLNLSEYTVSTHRRNMLDKTKLPNARALVSYAINHGML